MSERAREKEWASERERKNKRTHERERMSERVREKEWASEREGGRKRVSEQAREGGREIEEVCSNRKMACNKVEGGRRGETETSARKLDFPSAPKIN